MLEIHCSGTPYEIGRLHGATAHAHIARGLKFYADYFALKAKLDWAGAKEAARKFLPLLEEGWGEYLEEMRGIADGAGVDFEDILALNVRTEISMGLMADGCTALYWKQDDAVIQAQNWDWEVAQSPNLLALYITRPGKPTIAQITEGGIIGKIGLNSAGVATCLNAIRARGVSFTQLPTHLALRAVLDSPSAAAAIATLDAAGGCAAACHILIGDGARATGYEASCCDVVKLAPAADGALVHANHFVATTHPAEGTRANFQPDTFYRQKRLRELLTGAQAAEKGPTVPAVERMLEDEGNAPLAINRRTTEGSGSATLFSVVMDLVEKRARVRVGRPTQGGEVVLLDPRKFD